VAVIAHVVCDLTLASKEHAIFKQTDADVTSFDGGYGSAYLAKMVGQKKLVKFSFRAELLCSGCNGWGW
jgi:naphthoate synthase